MEFDDEPARGYEAADEPREDYRDRSGSPRARSSNGNTRMRSRSASPNGRERAAPSDTDDRRDGGPTEAQKEEARNTGTNLFVTGIHPKLSEDDVTRLFSKYGDVVKCNIMLDPHTKESRGFGFVNFAQSDQADAAKDALQGEVYEGRTLSIEKARRSRPRTPTPGKYFGPPKREDDLRRGPPPPYGRSRYGGGGGGGYSSRYGGGGGERGSYEDDRYYRSSSSRHDSGDRYYGGGGSRREGGGGGGGHGGDDYPPRGIDRYASSSRDDRYSSSRGEERRGGGGSGYYDRDGGRGGYESRREPVGPPGGFPVDDRFPSAGIDPIARDRGSDRDYYDRDYRR